MFKGISTLTCLINELVEQIVPLPVGSELLQEATDQMPLLCWLMLTLSLIKFMDSDSDLHDDYITVHIYMCLNNMIVLNCLNSTGGTHSVYRAQLCCQRYLEVFIEREIWMCAALIAGKNNTQVNRV